MCRSPPSNPRTTSPAAIQALSAALRGTQSLHTDSFDEALALPTEQHAAPAPSRSSPTKRVSPMWPIRSAAPLRRVDDRRDGTAGRGRIRPPRRTAAARSSGVYAGIDNGYFVGETPTPPTVSSAKSTTTSGSSSASTSSPTATRTTRPTCCASTIPSRNSSGNDSER